ncbi:MAG: DNA-3-methyladenine glycosylase [Thermoleophilia bacterium]
MVAALTGAFFDRPAGVVAPDLLGCTLLHDGVGGIIVEVERYEESDPASHSAAGPRGRAAVMFSEPGRLYVYRSYGIHWCLNVVCDGLGRGSALLVRALRPTQGLERMRERRGGRPDRELCSGPGRLAQALGVDDRLNGSWAVPGDGAPAVSFLPASEPVEVARGPRIGITRAVDRPWRYVIEGSTWLSKPMRTVNAA